MATTRTVVFAAIATALLGGPVWADHRHDDDKHWKKQAKQAPCYFQPHDVRVITTYYAPQYRSLPPGLAKKYNRTGHLPPGWQKKLRPFPVAVERQLVVLPPEYRRGVIDNYAVVYEPRTQVVIDVMPVFGR